MFCVMNDTIACRKGSEGDEKDGDATSTSRSSSPDAEAMEGLSAEKVEILNSVQKQYRKLVLALPGPYWPATSRTGKHSYTVLLGNQF